jgi:biopolymer transport protein TolR
MGFKLGNKDGSSPNAEINVTPLIDIMLVLLIIFIIAMPRTVHEMAMNLPSKTETKKKEDDSKPKQLMVAIYEDQRLALNREYLSQTELSTRLTAEIKGRESKVIFVDAHPDVNYAYVVEIFDLVRDAGPDKVGLARIKDAGPAKPEDPSTAEDSPASVNPAPGE